MVSLGIFFVVPPTEPCALRSTQPLKVSTTDFSWGKGGRCVWLTSYHPCSAETSRNSGALTYPEPLGPPRPVAGDLLSDFMNLEFSGHIFDNSSYIKLNICPVGVESFHSDRQTDKRTDRHSKADNCCPQFCGHA